MKYLIFLLATFLITANSLLAQNQQSQNKILEIDYFNHKASDIGVNYAKNLVEIKEAKPVLNSDKQMDFKETSTYRLKNEKIIIAF